MTTSLPLLAHFRPLKDPRVSRRRLHSLENILFIALCAVVAGANDFLDIAVFASKRLDWLSRFLDLPNGVPSHDTFERVFDRLDSKVFQRCFTSWMMSWHHRLTGKHLAIDGKAVNDSACPSKGLRCLHLVNVWVTETRTCLGMVACDAKSNEITAIPELLELLDLKGALVSIDAEGCQKKIAEQITEQGGDYLLAVKKNQRTLYGQIEAAFQKAAESGFQGVKSSYEETFVQAHGREERRSYVVIEDPEIEAGAEWSELKVIGMCYSERTGTDGKVGFETRYFIGSKRANARYYGEHLRGHWKVENQCHWRLDVAFKEDASRVQKRQAAINLAVVRRAGLNLTQREKTKLSIAKKRFAASLDTDYLETILGLDELVKL